MLTLPPSVRIYLAPEPVDLRKGFEGLGAIVRGAWKMDLFAGHLFVFLGRRLDRCKILFWDRAGLVVYYKRLEAGSFQLPPLDGDKPQVAIDGSAFASLLAGIDFTAARRGWYRRVGSKKR